MSDIPIAVTDQLLRRVRMMIASRVHAIEWVESGKLNAEALDYWQTRKMQAVFEDAESRLTVDAPFAAKVDVIYSGVAALLRMASLESRR